jgi:hypothetical protein
VDPKQSAAISQGINGYIYVKSALKFSYFLIKGKIPVKNNSRTSLICDVII